MNFNDLTLDEARRSPGNKWNRFDSDVIPSWVADMDFPVAKPIRDFIIDQGMRGDLKYTGDTSDTSVVDVFAERMFKQIRLEYKFSRRRSNDRYCSRHIHCYQRLLRTK